MDESRAKTLPTLLVGWKVWPFISLVSFMFVPPKLQVAFVNFIAIFWSAYMSYMKNHVVDHGKVVQPPIIVEDLSSAASDHTDNSV